LIDLAPLEGPAMTIPWVTDDNFDAFFLAKTYSVLLFDAPWDVGPGAQIRPRFESAAQTWGGSVNFGRVDCDAQPRLVRSIPICNVPTVAYYKRARLVAALVSASQDVSARVGALIEGRPDRLPR